MERFDYLIVGGGLAAASAVDGVRSLDADGTIALLTEEEEPPYHRPPLSKEYLQTPGATRDLLYVKPERWFEDEARVELLTGRRVVSLDPREMTVATGTDERTTASSSAITGNSPSSLTSTNPFMSR